MNWKRAIWTISLIATVHIILTIWLFNIFMGAVITGEPHTFPSIITILFYIILIPYTPLFLIPSFRSLVADSMTCVMALYSLIFISTIYFTLHKINLVVKQYRSRPR